MLTLSHIVLPVGEVIPQLLNPNSSHKSPIESKNWPKLRRPEQSGWRHSGKWNSRSRREGKQSDRPAIPDSGQTRDVGTAVVIWGCWEGVKIGASAVHELPPPPPQSNQQPHFSTTHAAAVAVISAASVCAQVCICVCKETQLRGLLIYSRTYWLQLLML